MNLKFLLLIFICVCHQSFAQVVTEVKTAFEIRFDTLLKAKNYEGILIMFKEFESLKIKTQLQNQIFYSCKGLYYSNIRRKEEALVELKKSLEFSSDTEKSINLKTNVYERIADINFTFLDFKQANKYAKLAEPLVNKSDYYTYINIHSIIGFCYFNQNDLKECEIEYEKVHKLILEKKDFCKEPEILMKIARLKDKLGKFSEAISDLEKCMVVAKRCNIGVYFPNILSAKYDILKNNKKYKEAVDISEKVYKTIDSLGFRKRNLEVYKMQLDFDNKLKDKENQNLKVLNNKEKELVNKQRWALFVTFFGLLLLAFLLIFLFRLNKKQKENGAIIAQNNKDLRRLNLLNQKIFTVISHDFKAPITTLRLFLKSEKISKSDNPMLTQYVNEATFQLDQSDAMINNLLDWAKMELNLAEGNLNSDLQQTINNAINQLLPQANDKNIIITNKLSSKISIKFPAEVALIVVRNILTNAIKFSFDNSNIEISFDNNCLKIKDYGKGISEDKIIRLFKSDVEAGFGTKFETGFGIGLYLSNELMVKHGGFITVTNNDNEKGCTFFINF